MWFKQRRARRIAEVRRQLEMLSGSDTGPAQLMSTAHLECGGREHLISAGTWLIAAHVRALQTRAHPQESAESQDPLR